LTAHRFFSEIAGTGGETPGAVEAASCWISSIIIGAGWSIVGDAVCSLGYDRNYGEIKEAPATRAYVVVFTV